MAHKLPRFITGRDSQNRLAGYLQKLVQSYGTATVESGATSVEVADTSIDDGDIIVASVMTKGTNACYVVGVTITDATKFEIAVNTDPGTGGAVISYVVIRPIS